MPALSRDADAALARGLTWVRGAVADVVDLAWPSTCLGCDAWGPAWCDTCASRLRGGTFTVTPRHAPHLDVIVAESFDGPLRAGVTAFKDRGRSDGAGIFAPLARRVIASALSDVLTDLTDSHRDDGVRDGEHGATGDDPDDEGAALGPLLLVPVPSSPAAYRERGRFPLGEICRAVTRRTTLADGASLLRHRGRGVQDQSRVSLAARRQNVEGAFDVPTGAAARLRRADARVILIDDVVTSGATLAAAHSALTGSGIEVAAVVALAATPWKPHAQTPA